MDRDQKYVAAIRDSEVIDLRNKKLLTFTLCMVLAMAAPACTGEGFHTVKYSAAETEGTSSANKAQETVDSTVAAQAENTDKSTKKSDQVTENQTNAKSTEEISKEPKPAEPQTQPPTETQTQPPTETQTQPPTETQTQPPTETQTQPPTEPQTQPPTETQTQPQTEPQTQPPTETQTEPQTQPPTESQTQPPTETQTQPSSETFTEVPSTETETEAPMTEEETDTEKVTESETRERETETESETDPEMETEEETGNSPYHTNEELIAHQKIVIPPELELEFRFTQVEKEYAVVKLRDGCKVYEEKEETSRAVGELSYCGICYILADEGQEWVYIESGNVRGFVKSDNLAVDDVAERIVKVRGEEELSEARLTVARTENDAFTYTRTTVKEVLAEKDYAIAQKSLEIYEQKKTSARVIGTLPEDGLCYILEDNGSEWLYIESGDARGFVKTEDLLTGKKAKNKVNERGEAQLPLAEVLVKPEDNKACYYTLTSVKKASQSALTRESMVKFALQFVGNPYVWGGTSLTAGADCSGYVQSIYAYYGYSLPRVACDQACFGMQIPVESALPGDLIFYAKNGYVYHVSMYIGNGQVVHAAGRKVGIITSGISSNAVWATRIIQD